MALLDQLLASAVPGEFPAFTREQDPDVTQLLEAQARKWRGRGRVPALTDTGALPGLDIMGGVGLLSKNTFPGMGDEVAPADPNQPPATNDPASGEPIVFKDGVPLPKPRPVTAAMPNTDEVSAVNTGAPLSLSPPSPTAPAAPQRGQAAAPGIGGMLGNFFRPENAPLLLSLAGGFSGAPSFGTGMRRAFSGSTPAAMQIAQTQTKQRSQIATLQALLAKGVPPQEAMAAVLDPNVMKATAAKYFETKPLQHVMSEDMYGNKRPMSFDPNTGRWLGPDGKQVAAAAGAGGTGTGTGLEGINSDLIGDEYLAQFPKEVQAAVKAYVRGDSMPTGNPRKGFTQNVKMFAQKYGEDIGVPVSDQKYVERRQYRNQLASGNPASIGGQRTALRQGLEHLEGVGGSAEKLGNVDLGVTWLSRPVNTMRGWSTTQQAQVNEMRNKVQALAGEVGKFFSGSQGGGVHEREETRKRFDAVSTPQELGAAIESTMELLEGGLHAREQTRDEILGPNSDVHILDAKDRERVQRIKEIGRRLRGEGGATPLPSGTTPTKKIKWSVE